MGRLPSSDWPDGLMWDHMEGCLEPLIEVQETESEIIVRMDMPFVERKEDIEIKLTEDSVSIGARMGRVIQYQRWGTFQRESRFFRYTKTYRLPAKIEPEKSKARFVRNILELKLPKKESIYRVEIR